MAKSLYNPGHTAKKTQPGNSPEALIGKFRKKHPLTGVQNEKSFIVSGHILDSLHPIIKERKSDPQPKTRKPTQETRAFPRRKTAPTIALSRASIRNTATAEHHAAEGLTIAAQPTATKVVRPIKPRIEN